MSEASLTPRSFTRRIWRRVAPLLVVNLFYFGVLVYPVVRIWMLISAKVPGTPALMVIMVAPVLGRLSYEFLPCTPTRWLSALSLTWLGICFMAFLVVLGYEVAHFVIPLPDAVWGLSLASLLAALTGYAFFNAQRLTVRDVTVRATENVRGTRIAQISDVHVGSRSGRFLRRVVDRVNLQSPDMVLITGDLIDFRDITPKELSSLADLQAPAYFIIGNHERYVDLEAICRRLNDLGIAVLRDTTLTRGSLQLIGIDDAEPKTQVGRVLKTLKPEPDAFRILLYHRPDGAEDAAEWGAHLMLCGHTHNGQIVPFNLIVRRIFPRIQGLYDVAGMHLYVSPGTGTWGPVLRLGSRSEISMITLT